MRLKSIPSFYRGILSRLRFIAEGEISQVVAATIISIYPNLFSPVF